TEEPCTRRPPRGRPGRCSRRVQRRRDRDPSKGLLPMGVHRKPSKSAHRYRDSTVRPELDDLVTRLAGGDQLVHLERISPRPPRTASTERALPTAIAGLVPEGGLWTHQAAAIDLARAGRSVAVATGTASGK